MCGFAGALDDARDRTWWDQVLGGMNDTLAHRGPDDRGSFVDLEAGLGLAHRRLAVLDLSPEGHQPMASHGGRFVIAYNGEIYNYEDIRAELDATGRPSWRGRSDTEVVLAGIERWGLEATVAKCVGMFAFALWDRTERTLHLVRDRLGIKPLYYGEAGRAFVFGSELRALRRHPDFDPTIDRDAVAAYLRHNYVPAPLSIYRGVRKLEPGRILRIGPGRERSETVYWSLADRARSVRRTPFPGDDGEAVDELERQIGRAVVDRKVADVPLGAFLSGGVDSSLVVALLQASSARPVRTFTIGFWEEAYDEAPRARAIAKHLGTEHHELRVEPSDALEIIPRIPEMWDEPFADSSQVPTFLVSRMARADVTVSLSGDGGDELFAGYDRYALCRKIWGRLGMFPAGLRRAFARGVYATPAAVLDVGLAWTRPWIRRHGSDGRPSDKARKVADLIGFRDAAEVYLDLVSHFKDPAALVAGGTERSPVLDRWTEAPEGVSLTERMMFVDTLSYLPDDILTKIDRASLAYSLEARVPLLDHRIVEFAARLPLRFKRNGHMNK